VKIRSGFPIVVNLCCLASSYKVDEMLSVNGIMCFLLYLFSYCWLHDSLMTIRYIVFNLHLLCISFTRVFIFTDCLYLYHDIYTKFFTFAVGCMAKHSIFVSYFKTNPSLYLLPTSTTIYYTYAFGFYLRRC